jgi:hypothetical protein
MLKKPANIVLASLRGSTYRGVRLASSLAAALLNGLFEHPATMQALSPYPLSQQPVTQNRGFRHLRETRRIIALGLALLRVE